MADEERIRRLRLIQQQQRAMSEADSGQERVSGAARPGALLNQGIANFADAIGGPVNRGINRVIGATGSDFRLDDQPGSRLMDDLNVPRADAENRLESAVTGAGEAAGALIPAGAAARGLATLPGVAGNVGRTLQAGLATRLGLTAEVGAGAGYGASDGLGSDLNAGGATLDAIALTADAIGRPISVAAGGPDHRAVENVTDSQREIANMLADETGKVGGAIAAGGGIGAIPSATRAAGQAAQKVPTIGMATRFVGQAAAPFTPQGARVIAEDTFRGVSSDPQRAADYLRADNVGDLTPAQQTGDTGIMGIERARAAADPVFRSRLEDRIAQSQRNLEGEVSAPAQGREPADMKAFFRERQEAHRETLNRYLRSAERRLDDAVRDVQPGQPREDASVRTSQIIDEAFDRASAQEKALWDRVPRDVQVGTSAARQALEDARIEATRISEDRIPAKARAFLGDGDGALGDTASMGELHRLYSEVRQAGREAMAQTVPDKFTYRQSNRIAEAILADIEAAEGAGRASQLLADARAFSREMNETFGQGNVSRILARTRAGDERMPPETVLRSTIGQPREAGGVAVDDIRRATQSEADAPMQDFLRDDFIMNATRADGTPDASSVERYFRSRREALDRFPDGVGGQVSAVRDAAREVTRRGDRVNQITAALDETTRGTVAGVVNAPKGREIARGIFEAENPTAAARAIAQAAQRDGTGNAYLGLKAGIYDEIIGRASSNGVISGERLARVLENRDISRAMRAALPEEEMSRLQEIASQMQKVERSLRAGSVDTENLPNTLLSTFIQIQAAKAGRAMGTGTIQVPGLAVSRARALIGRVANDRADALIKAALDDPQIMSDLLVGPSASARQRQQAEDRIANWAAGLFGASTEDTQEGISSIADMLRENAMAGQNQQHRSIADQLLQRNLP